MAYKALNFVIIVNRKSKRGGVEEFYTYTKTYSTDNPP